MPPSRPFGQRGTRRSLAFTLATIGVLLIAWTFVRLTQRFDHAGSVYGFVGATLGPRFGERLMADGGLAAEPGS